MEPTGHDTIVFTFVEPVLVMRDVLRSVRSKHDSSEFDLDYMEPSQECIRNASEEQCVLAAEARHSILYIYSSPSLREHLDEFGFVTNPSGEGACAIHIRRRHEIAFRLQAIDEIHSDNGPPGPPLPYGGWLCSPLVYEITVVTPGDPERQLFSKQMVEIVTRSCLQIKVD